MSLNVLVDTSVWSLALRRKPRHLAPPEAAIRTELSELVTAGRAQLIGIVRQELLSGIKSPEQYERLRKSLRAYPDEPVKIDDFEAAAKANNNCRAQGITGSAVDFLICAIAMRREWAIFHRSRFRPLRQGAFPQAAFGPWHRGVRRAYHLVCSGIVHNFPDDDPATDHLIDCVDGMERTSIEKGMSPSDFALPIGSSAH